MFLQILISSLVIGCVYGLIALGYSIIYKASALMSFVQGDMLTLGAFLGYTFYVLLSLPFVLSFVLVMIAVFFIGIILERGIIKRLVQKKVLAIYTVLATIAVSYIIQNGAMLVWGTDMKRFPSIFPVSTVNVFGRAIQTELLFCILVSFICMLGFHFFMKYSKLGTAMRAAAMDPIAAKACGINVSICTGITWGISAGIAAVAGMLIGPIYGVFTMLGATIGRKGFSSAVIGGFGNMFGAVIGGVILGCVETFTAAYISSAYKDLIAYVLLILFLFIKPTGIFNERAITE